MGKKINMRVIVALVFGAGLVASFAFGLDDYLSLSALRANEAVLRTAVQDNLTVVALGFVLIYMGAVALSLPGALVLTLAGGLLFGTWLGGALAVLGASIGACLLFLAARYVVGDALREKGGARLRDFEAGFNKNAVSYLLVMRLVPIFPFFVVNLGAALVGVRFTVFAATTFIGILPGTFIYASIGNGISALLQAGETPDLSIITKPDIILPLLGLALLASLPALKARVFDKKT